MDGYVCLHYTGVAANIVFVVRMLPINLERYSNCDSTVCSLKVYGRSSKALIELCRGEELTNFSQTYYDVKLFKLRKLVGTFTENVAHLPLLLLNAC